MARKSIPFNNVDTAWLQMEDPTNLMMITGVLLLRKPADFARLRRTVEYRLLTLDRFLMRPVSSRVPLRNPRWELDPHFDLDYHLHRIALPAPGNESTLQELVGNMMSMGLDFNRPLWQFHYIENVKGGAALFGRIHHSIGDDTALVAVMLSLMDLHPNMPLKPPPAKEGRDGGGLLGPVLNPARSVLKTYRNLVGAAWQESAEVLSNPGHALELTGRAVTGGATLAKTLLMPPDPKTIFKGPLGVQKRAAWSGVIPLADVKAVGKVLDAKVNDVLLTAMTGALRRYLIKRGEPVDGLNFRAAVPVNLRPMERALELGNEFSLIFLPLPVGIEDPHDRLLVLKGRMDAIKDSPEAIINFGILNFIGMSPNQLADQIVNIFGTKATAVMTNVPGPRMTLYLAGSAIDNMMFWVPQSGRLGMGVSIMSYDGKVTLGVATDAGLVPDPGAIIDGFHAEFDELMQLVRQVREDEAISRVDGQRKMPIPVEQMPDDNLAETMAQLEALEKKLVELEAAAAAGVSERERCQGITRAGRQCRNRALAESAYCQVHQPAVEAG